MSNAYIVSDGSTDTEDLPSGIPDIKALPNPQILL